LTGGDDFDELLRRWSESDDRSRRRRSSPPPRPRRRRRVGVVAVAVVLVVVGAFAATRLGLGGDPDSGSAENISRAGPPGESRGRAVVESPAIPSVAAFRRAWRFARRRGGQVSVAVVDTRGRLRGRDAGRRYASASVVKALLLAAELRRLRRERLPLDGNTSEVLRAMITRSDNRSADAIYSRVGDAGLFDVAKAAGLRRFTVAGHWGNAQVTAADLARLFSRLRRLVPRRHRAAALELLASITEEQRWGIPRAAGHGWRVHFKGGWRKTGRGELVHQAAWMHRGRRRLAIAILTDAQPSRTYGIHTVRGVADRLLATASR
jgi:beta-lactamase class A